MHETWQRRRRDGLLWHPVAKRLTVMSYNIRQGRDVAGVLDLDQTTEVIRAQSPTSWRSKRSAATGLPTSRSSPSARTPET